MNELVKEIMELTNEAYKYKKECERKDNIINELKEWARIKKYLQTTKVEEKIYDEFLDKIKKLEESK